MRLPKRGEKGFTLIELLIVVAILGVLAAVVIPNVTRFFGKGEEEAARTELHNIQTAITNLMVDNGISSIPGALGSGTGVLANNDMITFPDGRSDNTDPLMAGGDWDGDGLADKVTDPEGYDYDFAGTTPPDAKGYVLYGHDISGSEVGNPDPDKVVNYVSMVTTSYYYTCEIDGTVEVWADAAMSSKPY